MREFQRTVIDWNAKRNHDRVEITSGCSFSNHQIYHASSKTVLSFPTTYSISKFQLDFTAPSVAGVLRSNEKVKRVVNVTNFKRLAPVHFFWTSGKGNWRPSCNKKASRGPKINLLKITTSHIIRNLTFKKELVLIAIVWKNEDFGSSFSKNFWP